MKIYIQYYAVLREQRGLSEETIETSAKTAGELYSELQEKFKFTLSPKLLRVAVNDTFSDWNTKLNDGDKIIFIPPVAGG